MTDVSNLKPYHKNAEGDFFVEDGQCMICSLPHDIAPDLIAEDDPDKGDDCFHCYFKKQPETPDEIERAAECVVAACCEAIHYKGSDEKVLGVIESLYGRPVQVVSVSPVLKAVFFFSWLAFLGGALGFPAHLRDGEGPMWLTCGLVGMLLAIPTTIKLANQGYFFQISSLPDPKMTVMGALTNIKPLMLVAVFFLSVGFVPWLGLNGLLDFGIERSFSIRRFPAIYYMMIVPLVFGILALIIQLKMKALRPVNKRLTIVFYGIGHALGLSAFLVQYLDL